MKLCVFQGTFNPIHNAHLEMADFVRSNFEYDTILFIPAYKPPHKEIDEDLSNHRFQMVKQAIEGENYYHISNIEFQNERFSYTYLTIQELYKRYKVEGKIGFIIGTDAFKEIQSWYEADKLKQLVEFIVFSREEGYNVECLNHLAARGYNFKMVGMPFIDISASNLRELLQEGMPIDRFVPAKVAEYIYKNGLYRE